MKRQAAALTALLAACGTRGPAPETEAVSRRTGAACALAGGASGLAAWKDALGAATVATEGDACARTFRIATTAPLRDRLPVSPRIVVERTDRPALRSGSPLLDALYAVAHEEAGEASVGSIRDGSFDRGQPLACAAGGCFETGRLWTYVWTRDTSYAVALGLADVDPARSRSSLDFKLSERRGGGDLQIVQDTGSGGSWPISTDRVVWACGAARLLDALGGEERAAFAARALEAAANTIEQDRAIAFDAREGLYRGETSFLDWREQTYPAWTARDTVHIGMSRALSTNVGHLRILHLAADLAEERGDARVQRWRTWAGDLRRAIAERFALEGTPLLSAYRPTELDPAPVRRFDLLGLALAIDAGVVGGEAAEQLVASYPHLPAGAPVVWPQDREMAVYHNRAIWPFVTAHWLRAARRTWNAAVVTHGALSLVRVAALNLSHMENVEALTGAAWVDDGPRSGPVVNSQRQLWSVAGFLSMVEEVLFGLEMSPAGLRVRPMIPRALRRRLLGGAERLVLDRVRRGGAELTVVIALPADERQSGAYGVGAVKLDGATLPGGLVPRERLTGRHRIDVELVDRDGGDDRIALVSDIGDGERVFAPRAPELSLVERDGDGVRVRFALTGEDPARVGLRVYRDGAVVATDVAATARVWTDPGAASRATTPCYTVEAYYLSSGNTSHRAAPRCWEGARGERRRRVAAGRDGSFPLHAASAGEMLLRVVYRNPGPFNTGVTCAVRRIDVVDAVTGQIVASGPLLLPHTGDAPGDSALGSSWLRATIPAGRHHVRLTVDERTVNMSAFAHFARYTGGAGGAEGPRNTAEIRALEVLALSGRLAR